MNSCSMRFPNAWDTEDVVFGRFVEIDGDEHVLLQLCQLFVIYVLADLPPELYERSIGSVLFELVGHAWGRYREREGSPRDSRC